MPGKTSLITFILNQGCLEAKPGRDVLPPPYLPPFPPFPPRGAEDLSQVCTKSEIVEYFIIKIWRKLSFMQRACATKPPRRNERVSVPFSRILIPSLTPSPASLPQLSSS